MGRFYIRFLVLPATAVALALFGLASAASASVVPREAGFETGALSEFDQVNMSASTLTNTTERAYEGSRSAHAAYGGSGANAYSRGIWNVSWQDGDDVWYGAAYYLPDGFKSAMQGQVDLLRWDNWASMPVQTEKGGIVIFGSDNRARLVRIKQGVEEEPLTPTFDLPEGRWFSVQVHQRLSTTDALNEVYLDGELIASSTDRNSYGHAVDRIRYGLVATAGRSQTNPLELWFDQASVGPPTTDSEPNIDFESGSCSDLFGASVSCGAWNGTLAPTTEQAQSGTRALKATYLGGTSGHARGQKVVEWAPGDDVTYGASVYLPAGFREATQGGADIIRWDNYGSMPVGTERGGIALYGSDGRARLIREKTTGDHAPISAPFDLPEDRWFRLKVRQRFSTSDPLNEVFIDGQRVADSREPNFYGNGIDRLRFGLASVRAQPNPLSLYIDDVSAR